MPNESHQEHVMSDEERELLARARTASSADEFQDEYPPPPLSYRLDQEPRRHTNYCRLFFVACSVVAACTAVAALLGGNRASKCTSIRSAHCFGDAVLSAMDRSADPCTNFYEYACGSWMRKQVIPADRSSYSRSFAHVFDTIRDDLRVMLEKDLQKPQHPQAITGRFYTSCMRSVATGPVDVRVLRPFRGVFDGLKDSASFSRALSTLHGALSAAMYSIDIGVDEKHPETYAVTFSQGGLGLSHPDKYTSMKDSDVKLREAYLKLTEQHLRVAAKGRLVPKMDFSELAKKAFEFEKSLAAIHKLPEERRNPDEMYNPTNVTDFPEPLHFPTYLKELGIDTAKIHNTIVVEDPKYVREVANMMNGVTGNKDMLLAAKGYLALRLVRHFGSKGMMGKEVDDNEFEFHTVKTGVRKQPERWKRCQSIVSDYIGDSLGEAFVKKHFPEKRKTVAERLSTEITRSFGHSLDELDWMDDKTRAAAKDKLGAVRWKVGYTKKFDKYPGVVIRKRAYAQNLLNLMKYAKNYSIGRLGKPVDNTEWSMNAFEVNAYYSPPRNEIVAPGGILQQPFFSDVYPDAMNYGSIGMVLGHELSHGFDDEGRKYDKTGRLTPWWTPASAKKFETKAKCFVNLYNGYKPRSVDIYVKGNLTLGENLADTNGVKVAFRAFKNSGNNSDPNTRAPNPVLAPELTNHQLFFVSYAQTWCSRVRPKALKIRLLTDPHSPGQFRVQGPLSQNPDFAATFKCNPGATYNPEKKCAIW